MSDSQLQINWDYDESVTKMLRLIPHWKSDSIEMLKELHLAREELRSQGVRTDLTSGNFARSWKTYCEAIDLPKRTANHWLKSYDPVNHCLLEDKTTAHVSHNTGDNEWYTPESYIQAATMLMGRVDLDPASTEIANSVIKAARFYTGEENGLEQPWEGRVWMNPPYASGLIYKFSERLVSEYETGNVKEAVVLVNNATETKWFRCLAGYAAAVCFPYGRIIFWNSEKISRPLQGQAVLYFGKQIDKFEVLFKQFGHCWRK